MSKQDLQEIIKFSNKYGLMSYKVTDVLITYNTYKRFNK